MSTMLEDLAEVVRKIKRVPSNFEDGTVWGDENRFACYAFMQNHHSTIAQNAEDSKRLKALEQAMDDVKSKWRTDVIVRDTCMLIHMRADEIMREWTEGVG